MWGRYKLKNLKTILLIGSISAFSVFAEVAQATPKNENISLNQKQELISQNNSTDLIAQNFLTETRDSNRTIDEEFNEVFLRNSGDFFESTSFVGVLDSWFLTFPDIQINRDARLVSEFYQDYFKELTQSDPYIRTRDLANPFNTSIQENPSYLR